MNRYDTSVKTISLDIDTAHWIADRLDDFSSWPGITDGRAKKLTATSKRLRKLCAGETKGETTKKGQRKCKRSR